MPRPKRYFTMPDIDQPDPEPGYQHSSEEFIIPANDEEGHSARCQFRAPLQLLEWCSTIVASKKFPFQREGDLMRYGLYLACVQLSRIEKSVPSLEATVEGQAAFVRRRMHAASIVTHVECLAVELEKLRKAEAWGEITWILAGEQRQAEKQKILDPYWGDRWLKELQDRFGMLRTHAQSKLEFVSLRPTEAVDLPEEGE